MPVGPKKPEPKIVPFRPIERPAPAPGPRPSRQHTGPCAPPRVSVSPARPPALAPPPRPAPLSAAPPAAPAAVATAPPAVADRVVVEEPPGPLPVAVRGERIRVPGPATVGGLAGKMARQSAEVIKAVR